MNFTVMQRYFTVAHVNNKRVMENPADKSLNLLKKTMNCFQETKSIKKLNTNHSYQTMSTPLERPHLIASLSASSSGVSVDRDLRKLYFSLPLSSSSPHFSVLFLLSAGVFWDFSFVFLLMGLMSDRQKEIYLIKLSCLLYLWL